MIQNETDSFKAFDLVASALEELELHEASVRAQISKARSKAGSTSSETQNDAASERSREAIENAAGFLKGALKEDPRYFKADYLEAITNYFKGDTDTAVKQFEQLLGPAEKPKVTDERAKTFSVEESVTNEVRYNLGAAQLEANKISDAIANFKEVINHSEKDSLLQLSARVGLALSLARDSPDNQADARKEIGKIRWRLRRDAIFLFRIGWRNGLIIKKRKIDEQTADSFRVVLDRADLEVDRKESQTAPAG